MRQDRTCKYCNTFFPNEEGKVFANHVRWCDKNLTNGDKGASKCSQKTIERYKNEFGEVREYDVTCERCYVHFFVKEREKRHPERDIYFCSRSCANSRGPRSEVFKEKVRKKLSGRIISERITKTGRIISERITKICQGCNNGFVVSSKHPHQKCCSVECSTKIRYPLLDKAGLKYYRTLCSFKFNLADYLEEFDFTLIEKYGWYSAKNRGNNLDGVSRDHIVSVKYGFENNVDASIISHPANCRLMVHNSNVSKGKKCGMTLEQLQEKIKWWNEKYISRLG